MKAHDDLIQVDGRPILLVFGSISNFRLQRYLAQRLVKLGRRVVLVYERGEDEIFAAAKKAASEFGAPVVAFETFVHSASPAIWRVKFSPRRYVLTALATCDRDGKIHAFRDIYAALLGNAVTFLCELKPTAMIVNEDGISSSMPLIAAAKRLTIPVFDVPFGFAARQDYDIDLERKAATGDLNTAVGWKGGAIRLFAPRWVKRGALAGALMFPSEMVMAWEMLGMTLRDPWSVHGGPSNRLLADSSAAVQHYLSEGVPRNKIAITGSPYCDEMMEALADDSAARAALRKPALIEKGKLRILVSWPPSYHDQRAGLSEFPSYEEMTSSVLEFLRDLPETALTVSLHPAAKPAIRSLLEKRKIAVSDEHVIGLIPRHDVFVTYFSSTIRWAIAAGKPVLNYDAYQLHLGIYDHVPGVESMTQIETFKSRISELAASPELFRQAAARQCAVAENWGLLDGRCVERIVAEIDAANA